MNELYSINDKKLSYIEGKGFPVKREIQTIFAVPEINTVGTNALNNAITLLKFNDEKGTMKYDTVRRNFKKYVYGGDMFFLPEFSKDTIAYSQTRGFLLFNINDKTFMDFSIGRVLGIVIEEVFPIDGEKNLFLFDLSYLLGMDKEIKVLKLLDLTKEEPKEIAYFDIEKHPLWAALGKTTFYFTEEDEIRSLHALNQLLKPIDHPLCAVYNTKTEGVGRFGLPHIHPSLPFAILSENNPQNAEHLVTWVATWRDKEPKMYKIFGDNLLGRFQFSPDGKWLLFQDDTIKKDMLMVMPVDPDLPHFLSPPIMLQSNDTMNGDLNGKCAWISDPLSVVTTRPDKLIKWQISPNTIHYKITK
ncbi:MAG: hypothetical protein VR64_11140 [Desulfatitalea sp. BRH_c12]|nr:MAG: hypothetical protein VR64_11140 [Desulfatitalea sp. BRH_c12]